MSRGLPLAAVVATQGLGDVQTLPERRTQIQSPRQ